MAITASDLVVYASASMPTNFADAPGGAIDTTTKMSFTDMAATDAIVMSSNGLGDTVTVDVTGRGAGGTIVSDQFQITTTLARVTGNSATQFDRILRMNVSAGSHTGTITVEQDNSPTWTPIATLENGVNRLYRPFYNISSATGYAQEFFEKVFIKNNSTSNDLIGAGIFESSEIGFTNKITFDLAATGNDDGVSSNNRLGPPPATQLLSGTTGSWDDNSKNVVGSDLQMGSGQGIWIKLDLAAAEPADSGSWVVGISGTTT